MTKEKVKSIWRSDERVFLDELNLVRPEKWVESIGGVAAWTYLDPGEKIYIALFPSHEAAKEMMVSAAKSDTFKIKLFNEEQSKEIYDFFNSEPPENSGGIMRLLHDEVMFVYEKDIDQFSGQSFHIGMYHSSLMKDVELFKKFALLIKRDIPSITPDAARGVSGRE